MLPDNKKKVLAAIKRLNGLIAKIEEMVQNDAHCPSVLEMALAMKGHIEYIQSQVLASHLQTCAPKRLAEEGRERETFIRELLKIVGLSTR